MFFIDNNNHTEDAIGAKTYKLTLFSFIAIANIFKEKGEVNTNFIISFP
jgi:hypothetical protein